MTRNSRLQATSYIPILLGIGSSLGSLSTNNSKVLLLRCFMYRYFLCRRVYTAWDRDWLNKIAVGCCELTAWSVYPRAFCRRSSLSLQLVVAESHVSCNSVFINVSITMV